MLYKGLLVLFATFTLLDIVVTRVGLTLGLVELNQFVVNSGLLVWTVFRVLLIAYLTGLFFVGYRLCVHRFPKGLLLLKMGLFALNVYMGAVVFSGIFLIFRML